MVFTLQFWLLSIPAGLGLVSMVWSTGKIRRRWGKQGVAIYYTLLGLVFVFVYSYPFLQGTVVGSQFKEWLFLYGVIAAAGGMLYFALLLAVLVVVADRLRPISGA